MTSDLWQSIVQRSQSVDESQGYKSIVYMYNVIVQTINGPRCTAQSFQMTLNSHLTLEPVSYYQNMSPAILQQCIRPTLVCCTISTEVENELLVSNCVYRAFAKCTVLLIKYK